MKSYLFCLAFHGDGLTRPFEIEVDAFAELEGNYDFGYHIAPDSEFHPVELDPEPYERDGKTYSGMAMRARFANGDSKYTSKLFHVKAESDLSRENFQNIIDMKKREGTLIEFLDNGMIKV